MKTTSNPASANSTRIDPDDAPELGADFFERADV